MREMLPYETFDVLTFDCYGTLIDWETGLWPTLRPSSSRTASPTDEDLLARYASHEAEAEAGPYLTYRDVARARSARRRRRAGRRALRRAGRGLRRLSRRLARLPRLGGRARAAEGTLPPRRHHELRRRPVRRLDREARRRVRLGDHRPAGRRLQARPSATSSCVRAHRPAARADPPRRAEPLPRSRHGQAARPLHRLDRPPPRAEGGGATPPAEATPDATLPGHGVVRRRRDRLGADDRHLLGVDVRGVGARSSAASMIAPAPGAGRRRPRTRRGSPPPPPTPGRPGLGARPRLASTSAVLSAASVESTARPSAPPTCWEVLKMPEASPASSASMLVVAISVIGTNVSPMPMDMGSVPGTDWRGTSRRSGSREQDEPAGRQHHPDRRRPRTPSLDQLLREPGADADARP